MFGEARPVRKGFGTLAPGLEGFALHMHMGDAVAQPGVTQRLGDLVTCLLLVPFLPVWLIFFKKSNFDARPTAGRFFFCTKMLALNVLFYLMLYLWWLLN